ncbi:MAG TPA: glycosyltransferase family 39 protein [Rhodocyclaceae bacterium]|nr:glycosyltransferase family 39 protein [Rhodocyclaceae bacterium]
MDNSSVNNPSDAGIRSDLKVVAILAIVSLLVRLPFFFAAVINWDESSSILMAQSIINGHLPYTELWNVKPPLLYYIFSSFIAIFGPTIEAVRLGGTICVALCAICVYFCAKKIWSSRVGLFAGIISIILMTTIGGSQSTMSEHLALVPLLLSLVVLIRGKLTPGKAALVGALLSAAGMIRLNLAFVAVAVMLLVLFSSSIRNGYGRIVLLFSIAISGLAVIAATAVPHLVTGTADLWLSAVFLAPLSYASSQHGLIGSALRLLFFFIRAGSGLGLVVFLAALVFLKVSWRKSGADTPTKTSITDMERLVLMTYFASTALSILFSGGAFQHYLIQVAPFMAMFAAAVLVPAFEQLQSPMKRRAWGAIACIIVIASLIPALMGYKSIVYHAVTHETLRDSPEYAIADYLRQHTRPGDGIYMMSDHIVYWFLGMPPIDKAVTHPSNIAKEYLLKHMPGEQTTTALALTDLLSKAPRYIVKPDKFNYMNAHPDALDVLYDELASSYVLETRISGRQIYRRIK